MLMLLLIVGLLPIAAPAQAQEIIVAQAPAQPETEEQRKKRLEEERKKREQQRRPQPPTSPSAQPPQRPTPPSAQPARPERPAQQPAPPPARREVQEPPRPAPSPPSVQPRPEQRPAQQQPSPRREVQEPPRPAAPSAQPQQPPPRVGEKPEERRDPRDPRDPRRRPPERRDVQQPPPSPTPPPGVVRPPRQDAQPQQPRIGQPPAPSSPPPPAATAQPPTSPSPASPTPATPGVISPPRQEAAPDRRRIEELRSQRRERVEGGRTVIEEPDRRVIIRERDRVIIRHDETARFRRVARDVHVERGRGGEQVTIFRRPDGVQVVSVVDEHGRLIRRSRRWPDGREHVLIENTPRFADHRVVIVDLPPPRIGIPRERYIVEAQRVSRDVLYETLAAPPVEHIERRYTLDEVRHNYNLRARMRQIDLDTINFEFGSWEVAPDQVPRLEQIAFAINEVIRRNPDEVVLIEGHTDAVGGEEDNLSLSDRRAESVAAILSEHYQVAPENLTTQGYGEQHLKVPTQAPERQNRRVTVRRITPLLASGR